MGVKYDGKIQYTRSTVPTSPLRYCHPLCWRNNNDTIFSDAVCHDGPFTSQSDQYEFNGSCQALDQEAKV